LGALANEFHLDRPQLNTLVDEVKRRLEQQLSEHAGHIVASSPDRDLRYWIGK
jgi:hypothetical protein